MSKPVLGQLAWCLRAGITASRKYSTEKEEAMYKIEKGVTVPEGKERKYPFRAMEVGDSFFVPGGDRNRVGSSATMAGKRTARKFMLRCVDGGVRVWRVA